jgi:hypothetical protein
MIKHILKLFLAFVILLHCLGVTQFASSYARDKSAFVSMLNMAEEETKHNSGKEDSDNLKHFKSQSHFILASLFMEDNRIYISEAKVRITDQFISDNVSPPPDFQA